MSRHLVDRFVLILVGTCLPLFFLAGYFVISYHRTLIGGRWPLEAVRYNPHTGFEMTPRFSGQLLDSGFHTRAHSLGFRVPVGQDLDAIVPGGILSIGCSFTYGDEVEAEDTFTAQAGQMLGLPVYNFGVCAYSYASMLRQIRDLNERGILDQLRPSVILIGAGDWLVVRSLTSYLPSEDLQFAYPYIGRENDRLAVLDPPDDISVRNLFEFRNAYFPDGDRSGGLTLGRAWLLLRALPRTLEANFAANRERSNLQSKLPFPTRDLYDFFLGEIEKAIPAEAKPLVLWMTVDPKRSVDAGLVQARTRHPRFHLIDGTAALVGNNVAPEAYCCGRHPQPEAHRAYATAIVEAIKQLPDGAAP